MAPRSRVRRRAQACARCRQRKVHCDAQASACSLCTEAGVPCVAMDYSTKQVLPRSIAQYLETKIAEMERGKSKKPAATKVRWHHCEHCSHANGERPHPALALRALPSMRFSIPLPLHFWVFPQQCHWLDVWLLELDYPRPERFWV